MKFYCMHNHINDLHKLKTFLGVLFSAKCFKISILGIHIDIYSILRQLHVISMYRSGFVLYIPRPIPSLILRSRSHLQYFQRTLLA